MEQWLFCGVLCLCVRLQPASPQGKMFSAPWALPLRFFKLLTGDSEGSGCPLNSGLSVVEWSKPGLFSCPLSPLCCSAQHRGTALWPPRVAPGVRMSLLLLHLHCSPGPQPGCMRGGELGEVGFREVSSPGRHLFSTSIEAEGAKLAMPLWLWSSGPR